MEYRILNFKEVIKGKWSVSGNFLGECENGDIIHIYKKQMEYLGFQHIVSDNNKFTNNVLFPMFVLSYNKEFINSNGINTTRLTAASIFSSYKDLIDSLVDDINLETENNRITNSVNKS